MSAATAADLAGAISGLGDRASSRRRTAAKRLRKLKEPAACEALLEALSREVADPRTWETQYQMLMAVAETGCSGARPFIEELVRSELLERRLAPTARVALGDAFVRLAGTTEGRAAAVEGLLASGDWDLISGGTRALAMTRTVFEAGVAAALVASAGDSAPKMWLAAAAAGWSGEPVKDFLLKLSSSEKEDVRRAAQASLRGEYLKWNPL